MTFIFISSWLILFVFAIRLMSKGWNVNPPKDMDLKYNVARRTVTKTVHPEMEDVEVGDELLIVRFDEPKREMDPRFKLDSPELHNLGDSLHRSLQDRIDELNDDEDGDDDGDVVVRR